MAPSPDCADGRSCFMILAQALVALVFPLRGRESPWNAAAPWRTVYATLVDIGCLMLLVKFTYVEGIRVRDLVGKIRLRWGQDIFLGIGCLAVMMFLFAIPGRLGLEHLLASVVTDGRDDLQRISIGMGSGADRAQVDRRSGGGLWWALHHSFLPFILDWKYVV